MPTAPLSPGSVFARDYRVVRRLAEGGMGAVYVVEQLSTSELRALKLMNPRLLADPRGWQRFDQEARVAARIRSDHVVRVIAAGVDQETGIPWLCMELLHGRDLSTVLTERGALPPGQVATLFEQLCHALEQAHRAGVVHRDLKPENLFVAEPQSPGVPFTLKVLDFGIARLNEDARRTSILTEGVGTPMWMAPEQCEASREISPATDVWALGLIAFALLTCRAYWRSANDPHPAIGPILEEMLQNEIVPPSQRAAELGVGARVPPGFDAWFLRCVARDPAARFAHAGEARDALRPVLAAAVARAASSALGPTSAVAPGGTTAVAPGAAAGATALANGTTAVANAGAGPLSLPPAAHAAGTGGAATALPPPALGAANPAATVHATMAMTAPPVVAPGAVATVHGAPTSYAASASPVAAIGPVFASATSASPGTYAPSPPWSVDPAVAPTRGTRIPRRRPALVLAAVAGVVALAGLGGGAALLFGASSDDDGDDAARTAVTTFASSATASSTPALEVPPPGACFNATCDRSISCRLEARLAPGVTPIDYGEASLVRATVASEGTTITCFWEAHATTLIIRVPPNAPLDRVQHFGRDPGASTIALQSGHALVPRISALESMRGGATNVLRLDPRVGGHADVGFTITVPSATQVVEFQGHVLSRIVSVQ